MATPQPWKSTNVISSFNWPFSLVTSTERLMKLLPNLRIATDATPSVTLTSDVTDSHKEATQDHGKKY